MKKYLAGILLVVCSINTFGQIMFANLDFEHNFNLKGFYIDTVKFPVRNWQIGAPQKNVFKSAHSAPNVIVTNRTKSYPVNDTASFVIVTQAAGGFSTPHTVMITGQYYVNADSLTDVGKIEFSSDKGKTWINLINPGIYSSYIHWQTEKPVLTGNSNGWKKFWVSFASLGPILNIKYGDTLLYKFSFISDNIDTHKDGLMYDSFYFEDYVEGISEIQNDNLISIYPNPCSDLLTILESEKKACSSVQILNSIGEIVYTDNCFNGKEIHIKTFKEGIYYLKYTSSKSFAMKKFIVSHAF
jgi:hypothetical protein